MAYPAVMPIAGVGFEEAISTGGEGALYVAGAPLQNLICLKRRTMPTRGIR